MPVDILGVNSRLSSVTDLVDDPQMREAVLLKLDLMQRELAHTQASLTALQSQLRMPGPAMNRTVHLKRQLRDWIVSVVMTHGYLEFMIGAREDDLSFSKLAALAAERAHWKQGTPLRARDAVIRSHGQES
jgi:hypothetical protein